MLFLAVWQGSPIHREDSSQALSHFRRAIELDPNFAAAYGMRAAMLCEKQGVG
jgi:Flp pilus assembly protein TadD